MRLYLCAGGSYVGTQAEAKSSSRGRGFTEVDVPTDKPGLIAWLNKNAGPPAAPEPLEPSHDPVGGSAPPSATSSYTSPLDARTVIAGIDAGMVSSAVRQFDGVNLAKVMTAGIERMSELARQLDAVDLLA